MQEYIKDQFISHRQLLDTAVEELTPLIIDVATAMIAAIQNRKKILIMGNGGSAADSQHFAAELIGRFLSERQPLPAICLAANISSLTAIGNDYGFDQIFSRQINGLASSGDIVIALSTSGESKNILSALQIANTIGCTTIGLLGQSGGSAAALVDFPLIVASEMTPAIQEIHITIIHIICGLIERELPITGGSDGN